MKKSAACATAAPDLLAQAKTLHSQGHLLQAAELYQRILTQDPQQFEALLALGAIENQNGHAAAALELFDRASLQRKDHPGLYFQRGNALRYLQRHLDALNSYDRALALKPDYVAAHYNRANTLRDLKQQEQALAGYDRALELKPDFLQAHLNRATTLLALQRTLEAIASYQKAAALQPQNAQTHYSLGLALQSLGRLEDALASYQAATGLAPNHEQAWFSQAHTLQLLKRLPEALTSYDRVLALNPQATQAWNNRGPILHALGRLPEALASFERAIALQPDHAQAHGNRGKILQELDQPEAALASYDRSLALNPSNADVAYDRANVLLELKQPQAAVDSYAHALKCKSDYPLLMGDWLHTKLKICDWSDLDAILDRFSQGIDAGETLSPAFALVGLDLPASQQNKYAKIYTRHLLPVSPVVANFAPRAPHRRLRVGYFSADFHDHATAYLMAELFEKHDKARFEFTAFSFGPPTPSPMRSRLEAAFDRFLDVSPQTEQQIAQLARQLEIDIAIDLKGYTSGCRPAIFAQRAAPVQVSYLGYPSTMGASFIDYLIADHTLIPPEHAPHYSEKIVYLPHSYQVNDSHRVIADKVFSRAELGLPSEGFVFCSFNNNWKISPKVFDVWMRLLQQVKDSVLWLLGDNETAVRNLQTEAKQRGVEPERLVFAPRIGLSEHLARHRAADLFLDTLPCNAHTTASDALWAGLPVLTQLGETFAGRVAGSLLRAVGLPELVTSTLAEYEALALELATHPTQLQELRQRLAQNRLTYPLFNPALSARHLEAAYLAMWERYEAGLGTGEIEVRDTQD